MKTSDRPRVRALVSGGVATALGGALLFAAPMATASVTPGVPAGLSLTSTKGITVTKDNTVIDGAHVNGAINIKADNVTIKRSKVSYSGYHSIRVFDGAEGTRLSQVTVECGSDKTNGIVFGNYSADAVALEGCRNDFMFSDGSPAVITNSSVDGEPYGSASREPEPPLQLEPFPVPFPALSPSLSPSPAPAPSPGERTESWVRENAGPRHAPTATISNAEAVDRIIETGLLERVHVRGGLNLHKVARPYTIRDVSVDANGASYGIRTMVGYQGVGRPSGPQVLEHVEVYGAASAGLYVRDVTVRHANVWGNIDNVKTADRVEMYASWLHDMSWVEGAHADAIQLQYGMDQYFHWNVIDARYGSRGGPRAGQNANAGLQTGGMLGNGSARFHNNWWNGGHYTIRLGNELPLELDYQFRNNRLGRDFTYGPVSGPRNAPSGFGGVRFDSSNVWADTGQPV